MGYVQNLRRYFVFSNKEWRSLLVTAAVVGFILSFNRWDESDIARGIFNLIFFVIASFVLLWVHVAIQKAAAIRLGLVLTYDHYIIGLLFGLFVAFFTSVFAFFPLFIVGSVSYRAVDNLRIGRFRAVIPKNWEMALVAVAGAFGSLFVALPFTALSALSGAQYVAWFGLTSYLIGLYSLLPVPVIRTTNPYTVYMSRLESLEGNTPGFDLLYASVIWYMFVLGYALLFGLLLIARAPTLWTVLGAIIGGFLAMFVFTKVRAQYAPPAP